MMTSVFTCVSFSAASQAVPLPGFGGDVKKLIFYSMVASWAIRQISLLPRIGHYVQKLVSVAYFPYLVQMEQFSAAKQHVGKAKCGVWDMRFRSSHAARLTTFSLGVGVGILYSFIAGPSQRVSSFHGVLSMSLKFCWNAMDVFSIVLRRMWHN